MLPYLKIVASMLVWSTWGMMIRWMELPPVIVLFYTALVASITVPVVLKFRGELDLSGIGEAWPLFGVLALSSITNNITYFYALDRTTVSNAVFTHYTAPVLVAVLAPWLLAEQLQKVTIVSLLLAVAGMGLILLSDGGLVLGGAHTAGIISGAISGVAYAFLIIVSRRLSRMMMHHKAVVVLLWITVAATAPWAVFMNYRLNAVALPLLAITGIVHSTMAPLLYYGALRTVIAQHAAILGYIEPLAAIPLAYFLLAEVPATVALLGGAFILVSGYLVVHFAARERRSTD